MSDDLNNKIKQIAEILGQDSMPDNVKGLLALLSNAGGSEEAQPQPKAAEPPARKEERPARSGIDDNTDMFRMVRSFLDTAGTNSDPRLNLVTAMKPFLNSKRQQKLSNCMMLLQMSKLSRLMQNDGKGNQ